MPYITREDVRMDAEEIRVSGRPHGAGLLDGRVQSPVHNAQGLRVPDEQEPQRGVGMEYHGPKFTGHLLYVKPSYRAG